jgi:RNA polymerase sigma-70 factor (ECF subfamily)
MKGRKMMDETDLNDIYREFRPKIERYLGRLAGEDEAADLTQTVFLKVGRGLETFRGDSSLSTWIYRIATNVARDHARTEGTAPVFEDFPDDAIEQIPDEGQERIDLRHIRKEMRACIREMVEQLPESYRAVLLLSDFEELTNPQIAQILDLSVETVKIRLHRARARLRSLMECGCTFYRDADSGLMCDRKEEK